MVPQRLNFIQVLIGAVLFTVVEVVTLGLWFLGSAPAINFSRFGIVALVVGLLAEHIISIVVGFNVSNGRAWYDWPF